MATVDGMRLQVLGPVEVTADDGSTTAVGPPREQIVAAALALAAPDAVSTGQLIDVLWGDEPPATAAATLKSLIHRLRRRHGNGLVATVTGGYRLGSLKTDVATVRSLVESGRAALAVGDVTGAVDQFERALSHFKGPPTPALASTVPGMVLAREIDALRERAAEDLVDARLAAGAGGELLGELEAAVVADPLQERSWERLMVALYRSGRQAGALGAFQRARNALVEGAGIEPGPGLRDLEQRIMDQDPALLGGSPGVGDRPDVDPPAGQFAGSSLTPDLTWAASESLLVGRAPDLAVVTDAIAASVEIGDRRLVLISGDAGMGKTRLAAEAASAAAANGAMVLYGRCEDGSPAPYRPFSAAIGRFADINHPEIVEPLLGPAPELLARLVPSLRDSFDIAAAATVDPDGDSLRSYDAVSRLLDQLGAGHGVVLVLDDLHWATAPTVSLMHHLLASAGSALTIIGTYRPRDLTTARPFASALALLHRNPNVSVSRLERLGGEDIQRYVEHAAGQQVPAAFIDQLASTTGGVPYLLTSTLTYLTDSEGAVRRSGRWELEPHAFGSLPAGVKHLISEQLARLDGPTVTFLRAAAVMGAEFAIDVIAEVTGIDGDGAVDAVEAAEFAGLVRELDYGRWSWGHDLARSVVLGDISTTRRVQTHWKIAETLVAQPRINHDDVARHATEGLLAGPAVQVAQILRDAAEDALDRSPAAALGYVNTALEALDDSDDDPGLRATLLTLRAITTFETCEDPDDQTVEDAMVDAERASLLAADPDLIVRAHTIEGRYPGTRQFLQFDERRVTAALNALDRLPADAADQRAVLLGHLAELHYFDWDAPSRKRVTDEFFSILDDGKLSAGAAQRAERSLAAFTTVTLEGESLALRDRKQHRHQGARHNNFAESDSRDAVEGSTVRLDMQRLEVAFTNGDFRWVGDQLAELPNRHDSLSLNDQITKLRARCIMASAKGDVATLSEAVLWIEQGKPKPRLRTFLQELRRELLLDLARITGEDHGGSMAFEQVLQNPKSASSFSVLHRLGICWERLSLGDTTRAEEAYQSLEPGWITGRASITVPGSVGALAAESVSRFGTRDEIVGVGRLLAPLAGTWVVLPAACLGPVDLARGVLAVGMGKDPTQMFDSALTACRAAGATYWESETLRLAQASG